MKVSRTVDIAWLGHVVPIVIKLLSKKEVDTREYLCYDILLLKSARCERK